MIHPTEWNWPQIKRDAKPGRYVGICHEGDCPVPFPEAEAIAKNWGLELWIDEEEGEICASLPDIEPLT